MQAYKMLWDIPAWGAWMPLKSNKTFLFFPFLFLSLLCFAFISLFLEKLRYSCYAKALRKEGGTWAISDLPGPKTPEGEVDLAA